MLHYRPMLCGRYELAGFGAQSGYPRWSRGPSKDFPSQEGVPVDTKALAAERIRGSARTHPT